MLVTHLIMTMLMTMLISMVCAGSDRRRRALHPEQLSSGRRQQ